MCWIKKGVTGQNVEAHNDNVNAAEPAVKTDRYHVIATVATLDASYPIQLWSNTIPQMQYTLNMYGPCNRIAT